MTALLQRRSRFSWVFWSVAVLVAGTTLSEPSRGQQGIAATVHSLASEAAVEALRKGGNAIDATVAAALTLAVVDGHNSGLGGGCFLLIRLADGRIIGIDGRETAPAAASADMFIRGEKVDSDLSRTGALASGIPGALAAYGYAVKNFGKLSLRDLALPAARIAEDGFTINRHYAQRLQSTAKDLNKFDSSRAIFLDGRSDPWKAGHRLRQADLSRTLRNVAESGVDWFYRGSFATRTADWMRHNGGLLTEEDFREYRLRHREPIRTTYRGHEIIGFPPPSSGGVHVAQILNIVEHFDLKSLGAGSAEVLHLLAESMKLAFADRSYWLGDPDFARVPRGLVSKTYAAGLAARIRRDAAVPVPDHGEPPDAAADVFTRHTTHFCAADAEGNWVACTATINTSFGSKVVVPGTGVVLNNQMDDFSARPGATNYFGLVGAEANAIAPGKRPLSSMSPTLVLKGGKPVFSVGAAGGPTIITQVVLAIVNTIDFEMPLDTALAQPRFHHQWRPDELIVEKAVGPEVIRELERRGHTVRVTTSFGASQAIAATIDGAGFLGAHDPRVEGRAAGW